MKEKKIYQATYNLSLVTRNKKSFFERFSCSFLMNPFQKIAGVKAVVYGGVLILLMSYLGVATNVYFTGPFGVENGAVVTNQSITTHFFLLVYQNLMIC